MLYYCRRPLETLRRYEPRLAARGVFVVSIFHKLRHLPILNGIERRYGHRAEVVLGSGGERWTVRVLEPRG